MSLDVRRFPTWLREVDVALPSFPHIVLTGDTADLHLLPNGPTETTAALRQVLQAAGFGTILAFDPVRGLTEVSGDASALRNQLAADLGVRGADGDALQPPGGDVEAAAGQLRSLLRVMMNPQPHCALLISGASRLAPGNDVRDPNLHAVMVMAEAQASAVPARLVTGTHQAPLYPVIVWLLDQPNDLPTWFMQRPQVRSIAIPRPTVEQMERLARLILTPMLGEATPAAKDEVIQRFADSAAGLSLRSISQITQVAIDQGIELTRIEDAVRLYRVGIPDNPWHDKDLRKKISWAAGDEIDPSGVREPLSQQVLGQPRAIRKALDVLIRSTTGLTGAQVKRAGSRPQGVLFFAGPTGVGKTELAKALAALVFGEGDTFIRFDMSEFSAEASEARLIGSPPGYIGSDAGGELTNAVRERPFSVLLFDEIDKAHPRIMDKFLQILEDGRLTSGTGTTVHFGETLIIFTSNLGVYVENPATGHPECVIQRAEELDYDEFERRILESVRQHFTSKLGRPEILNRIGENNIVVFEFISDEVGDRLVDKFLANVVHNVATQAGIGLEITTQVRDTLKQHARDGLDFGGRGVSTAVETLFVNPLSRHLINLDPAIRQVTVHSLRRGEAGGWEVEIQC